MTSIGENNNISNVCNGLLFPEIVAEIPVRNKARYFSTGKRITSLPCIFERKPQLWLPKTFITRRGPLALWSHQHEGSRGTKDNFQAIKTLSIVGASQEASFAEVPSCQLMETTRELKRGILNYHAQQSGQDRDIRPGHSARRYLLYWRQSHTENRSVLEQLEHNGQKRRVVNHSENHVRINQTSGYLGLPPLPYEIPRKLKTITIKCPDCKKKSSNQLLRASCNGRMPQRLENITSSNKSCSKGSRYQGVIWDDCQGIESSTHITYPMYWINNAISSCSYCNHCDMEEPYRCDMEFLDKASTEPIKRNNRDSDSLTSSDASGDNHRQNRTADSVSTMSSGDRYIRIKLDQVLHGTLNKIGANKACDLIQTPSHISIESEKISK